MLNVPCAAFGLMMESLRDFDFPPVWMAADAKVEQTDQEKYA